MKKYTSILPVLLFLLTGSSFADQKEIFSCTADFDWVYAKRHAFLPLGFNADGVACKHAYAGEGTSQDPDRVTGPCFVNATVEKQIPGWKMTVIHFETMGNEVINVPNNYRSLNSFNGVYYFATDLPDLNKPLFDYQSGAMPMHCKKVVVKD